MPVGGVRGAGRRQARALAGAEWHGVGGRGRWKRPFDFPILPHFLKAVYLALPCFPFGDEEKTVVMPCFFLPASIMVSAIPAASMRGTRTSALEDRGVRGLRCHTEGAQVA